MPDELRSRLGAGHRLYSLVIAKDLFGTIRLVRNWSGSGRGAKRRLKSTLTRSKLDSPRRRRHSKPAAGILGSVRLLCLGVQHGKRKRPLVRGAL